MKVILQDRTIVECNADEFQQIYPTIMNGHDRMQRTKTQIKPHRGELDSPLVSEKETEPSTNKPASKRRKNSESSISEETFNNIHNNILQRFPEREFKHEEVAEALQIPKSSLHRYFNVAVEKNLLVKLKPAVYQVNQSSHNQTSQHKESKEKPQEPTPSLSSNPTGLGSNNAAKNVSLSRKALVTEQTQKMFPEMYKQLVFLYETHNDLSYSRIRKQFANCTADVVDDFISIALQNGKLKSMGADTYILPEVEAEVPVISGTDE